MRKSLLMALFGALLAAAAVAATALAVGGPAPAAQEAQGGGMPMGAGMRMGPDGRMEMVAQQAPAPAGGAAVRPGSGKVRTYYIAADEIDWDYAPQRRNLITGEPFGDTESVFVKPGPDRIGSVYKKAVYREYKDGSFTTLKGRPERWQHLGLLGPVIRAEVGDTIRVVFKNHASRPYSVHPHGVFYAKDSEGAPYNDGTSGAGAQLPCANAVDAYAGLHAADARRRLAARRGSSCSAYHSSTTTIFTSPATTTATAAAAARTR